MLQSIENNAGIIVEDLDNDGIIGEDLALLHNYYIMCALNRLLTCVEPVCMSVWKIDAIQQQALIFVCQCTSIYNYIIHFHK